MSADFTRSTGRRCMSTAASGRPSFQSELAPDRKSPISPSMPPELTLATTPNVLTWNAAALELQASHKALATAPAGIVRQRAYTRWVTARNQCTTLIHAWWAQAMDLQPVQDSKMIFSLDVDGVLEDERAGFSCTGARGAAALRLLQLGKVAVLLNTARSLSEVRERVQAFRLVG